MSVAEWFNRVVGAALLAVLVRMIYRDVRGR